MILIEKARIFAQEKHKTQKRKTTKKPYFTHLEEVVQILIETEKKDKDFYLTNETISAAYLHDTIDGTETSLQEIEAFFGEKVTNLVYEVSNKGVLTDGNRMQRKAIDHFYITKASIAAKNIKLADLISNLQFTGSLSKEFRKIYVQESRQLLVALSTG